MTALEVRRVIAAARPGRDRALIRLLAETGIRRAEAANVSREDVRWAERVIVVRNGKGGKTRVVPITRELSDELRSVSARNEGEYLFRGRGSGPLSLRQINRIVADAGRRANVRHPDPGRRQLTCHLFRHTFARLWKDAGGSIESLSKILGHSSQVTTMTLYGTEGLSDVLRNYHATLKRMKTRPQRRRSE